MYFPTQPAQLRTRANEQYCRIAVDPDILDLGVRLGLYLQIVSNFLIAFSRPAESTDSHLPTALFLARFFIALLYSTVNNDFPPAGTISCTWYPLLVWISEI